MASMREVAEQAGVSLATVSKVLNNYSDVSRETRDRVHRTIRELDYRPNVVARSLAKQRSWTVGIFLLDHLTNPFIAELFEGLRSSLEDSGFDLMFLSPNQRDPAYTFARHCLSRNVDGVAVLGIDPADPDLLDLLRAEIPTVMIENDLTGPRAGYVTADNHAGLLLGVHHLAELGHRRIAFISGDQGYLVGRTRMAGYRAGLDAHGIAFAPELVEIEDYTFEGGNRAMRRLLALEEPPTGILCSSDTMAVGAIHALHEAGLRVPGDVSVVGYDNTFVAARSVPRLTTVDQHVRRMGAAAGGHLVRMASALDAKPPAESVPVELIVGDSTGPR